MMEDNRTVISNDQHDYEAFRLVERLASLKRIILPYPNRMIIDGLTTLGHLHPTYQRYSK